MNNLAPVSDPAEWRGDEIASGEGWKYILSNEDVMALTAMADQLKEKTGGEISSLLQLDKSHFDLGCFSPVLDQIYTGLKSGLGIALIKGLPIDEMTKFQAAAIYWGIGMNLGEARPNNPQGDMLGLITDLGKTQSDPTSRGYQTKEAMDYHCDQCDIVGLLCVQPAKSGGVSKIASSVAMYNDLLSSHPAFAQSLAAPLYWTKHGEHGPDDSPFYTSPVFNFLHGKLCVSFGPKHILKGHDLPGTPELSPAQKQAIATAEQLADAIRYEMELEKGDMQFLNNYVALHTRSAFVDHEDPAKKRLLWRLWLMNPDLRERTAYAKQWEMGVALGQAQARIAV